jgi:hypothetical protein
MPDKQTILCDFNQIPEEVHHILFASIIRTEQEIIDGYLTLFEGQDVSRPTDQEPALVRYHLDSTECGMCNAYIMGM